jgi:hypothetical protein
VKQKIALNDKKLRAQINGKFNYIGSAYGNKKYITVEPLFKNYKKTINLLCRI